MKTKLTPEERKVVNERVDKMTFGPDNPLPHVRVDMGDGLIVFPAWRKDSKGQWNLPKWALQKLRQQRQKKSGKTRTE